MLIWALLWRDFADEIKVMEFRWQVLTEQMHVTLKSRELHPAEGKWRDRCGRRGRPRLEVLLGERRSLAKESGELWKLRMTRSQQPAKTQRPQSYGCRRLNPVNHLSELGSRLFTEPPVRSRPTDNWSSALWNWERTNWLSQPTSTPDQQKCEIINELPSAAKSVIIGSSNVASWH